MKREPPSKTHAGQMFLIMADLANFRADINACVLTDPEEILRTIDKINLQLRDWKAALPRLGVQSRVPRRR